MSFECFALVDTTGKATPTILDALRNALDVQLSRDHADAWNTAAPHVEVYATVEDAPADAMVLALFTDADVAGALGYHDTTPEGHPYARIFAGLILANGGTWIEGANSVSQCLSHEALETLGDEGCNRWADTDYGYQKAVELCDFVETDSYVIDGVAVSNFLLPKAFMRGANGQYDLMGLLSAADGNPRPGCYEIRRAIDGSGGDVFPVYGSAYPEWKKAAKAHERARTKRRGVDVTVSVTVPFGAHVPLAASVPLPPETKPERVSTPRICLSCTFAVGPRAKMCGRCGKPLFAAR